MVRTVLSQLRVNDTPGDGEGGLGTDGVWAGPRVIPVQSMTIRKKEPEGDMTHQGLLGPQLGGHSSSAYGGPGTCRLCSGRERKRHSER